MSGKAANAAHDVRLLSYHNEIFCFCAENQKFPAPLMLEGQNVFYYICFILRLLFHLCLKFDKGLGVLHICRIMWKDNTDLL